MNNYYIDGRSGGALEHPADADGLRKILEAHQQKGDINEVTLHGMPISEFVVQQAKEDLPENLRLPEEIRRVLEDFTG